MARPKPKSDPNLGALIRKRRKQLDLTLQALCDDAGLSVGYLSQVERGHATPSLGTLAQIAQGLDVGLEYFIATPKPADSLSRAGARPQFSLDGSSIIYESLGAEFPGAELSSYILHVPPGYASETVSHEGEEIIFLLDGEITQMLDGQSFILQRGDSLHYSGSTPHSWSNQTKTPARILWTGTLSVLQRKGAVKLPEMTPANTNG
ncbi:cupin domain-containing protein [Roseobacter sp. HKCCD9010]|uniref:helix-turn-helix domain-containing protein n=1 Tax=Rhodobacterales TaxID=204455 RepID=UPI0011995A02|nr:MULTISPECIES: XRE family transcriptional regulator [Rhodobacterales]MBF9048803.1 cupin domain-containing protein [Rhodobacterales bacterium HKCCD4356]NNV10802.1 cupin domain-containing protein [Roseobacter sp. HKCCD7357]NNV14987.1 cupin domain-containing protein [Roseobacter sp. HKCCD8768]NNV24446.1 cupin domain-containing protein [Roseobacter sp. HKCCD8192]NNV28703.1 cupin domain-containing protein [Roseobacter sp. HKCCD9061]